jgi:long-chain fatty acid transport protein
MSFCKKMCVSAFAAAALVTISSAVFAGSIDYLSNQSADYIRTFSRNAAMDSADIAVYNPAGTAFLKQGFYIQYSHQTILKDYSSEMTNSGNAALGIADNPDYDRNYKTSKPTPILPSLFAIYNGGNWAGYFAASATAGGGSMKFDDGMPTLSTLWNQVYAGVEKKVRGLYPVGTPEATIKAAATSGTNSLLGGKYVAGSGKFKGTSFYPQGTLGGSYAVNEMISFSAAGRFVWGVKRYDAKATYGTRQIKLDADEDAKGFGGIFGIMVKPMKDLVLSGRYETQTIMNWKTTINKNRSLTLTNGDVLLFKDGATRRKDLPAMMALGAAYTFFDRVTALASFDGFFIGQADQQKDNDSTIYNDGYDDDYASFGWEASLAVEVVIVPKFLKLSAGYMYNKLGGNKDTYNDFDFSLDSNTFCGGGKVSPLENLDFTFGFANTRYVTKKNTAGNIYRKDAKTFALSTEYRV